MGSIFHPSPSLLVTSSLLLVFFTACKVQPKAPNLGMKGSLGLEDCQSTDICPDPGPVDPDPDDPTVTTPEGNKVKATAFITALPRISHTQYLNAARDLLLLSEQPKGLVLLPDPQGSVFQNNASNEVSSDLRINYQEAADTLSKNVASDANQLKKLIPQNAAASGDARAKSIVESLARRAFRRPATSNEVNALISLYKNGRTLTGNNDETAAGVQIVLSQLLQSPYFIYKVELGDGATQDFSKLDAYEVAARMAFGAWNSIPDEELLNAAANKSLLTAEGLKTQAARLMKDRRSADSINYFHAKGFGIDKYLNINKDAKAFPEWSKIATSPDIFRSEAEAFLNEVAVVNNKGLNEIMAATYTFANETTAPLYGVSGIKGSAMQKINLDPKQRSGLFSQIGYLASTSSLDSTKIIHRGAHLIETFLCPESAIKKPDAKDPPEKEAKTQRERVNAQTGPGTCGAICHAEKLNPPGFAFENYNADGKWRTTEANGATLDTTGKFVFESSVVSFKGPVDFIQGLAKTKEFHKCYVKHAIEYLFARSYDSYDVKAVEALTKKSIAGLSTRDLFIELLANPDMMTRRPNKTE